MYSCGSSMFSAVSRRPIHTRSHLARCVLIVTTGIARISSRVHGALIGLVGAGLAVALFHLGGRGVSLLGALSLPLPHLALLSPLATSLHDSGCGLLDPEHRPYLCD